MLEMISKAFKPSRSILRPPFVLFRIPESTTFSAFDVVDASSGSSTRRKRMNQNL